MKFPPSYSQAPVVKFLPADTTYLLSLLDTLITGASVCSLIRPISPAWSPWSLPLALR